jgi:hypothetical protein
VRKVWKKIVAWFNRLETKDARRSVAADIKKASQALFGLLLVSLPGAYAAVFQALAVLVDVKVEALEVSNWTLVALGAGASVLRVLAFLLECDLKQPDKPDKARAGPSKK